MKGRHTSFLFPLCLLALLLFLWLFFAQLGDVDLLLTLHHRFGQQLKHVIQVGVDLLQFGPRESNIFCSDAVFTLLKKRRVLFFSNTHIVPAELQHRPDQGELLVDLLALQVGKDLLEAIADAVHGHVATEDDTKGKHVKKDATLHGQLLVAGCSLLLWHAVLEGCIVKVHLVNLQELGEGLVEMKLKTTGLRFPVSGGNYFGGDLFQIVCICTNIYLFISVAVTLLFLIGICIL